MTWFLYMACVLTGVLSGGALGMGSSPVRTFPPLSNMLAGMMPPGNAGSVTGLGLPGTLPAGPRAAIDAAEKSPFRIAAVGTDV